MSEHRFTVYVGVNITERPDDERTDAEFAEAVIAATGTVRCETTDGWADCVGTGWITEWEYEESHP